MPRPLRESPPSSAVARLLDVGAAARALAVPAAIAPEPSNTSEATASTVSEQSAQGAAYSLVKREFVLTPPTERVLSELLDLFRRSTGARLSASHLLRALLLGLEHSRPSLELEARRVGQLKLPGNARERESDRLRFERRIAAALVAGMRAAAALDPNC